MSTESVELLISMLQGFSNGAKHEELCATLEKLNKAMDLASYQRRANRPPVPSGPSGMISNTAQVPSGSYFVTPSGAPTAKFDTSNWKANRAVPMPFNDSVPSSLTTEHTDPFIERKRLEEKANKPIVVSHDDKRVVAITRHNEFDPSNVHNGTLITARLAAMDEQQKPHRVETITDLNSVLTLKGVLNNLCMNQNPGMPNTVVIGSIPLSTLIHQMGTIFDTDIKGIPRCFTDVALWVEAHSTIGLAGGLNNHELRIPCSTLLSADSFETDDESVVIYTGRLSSVQADRKRVLTGNGLISMSKYCVGVPGTEHVDFHVIGCGRVVRTQTEACKNLLLTNTETLATKRHNVEFKIGIRSPWVWTREGQYALLRSLVGMQSTGGDRIRNSQIADIHAQSYNRSVNID